MIKNCLQCNKEVNIRPYREQSFKYCSFNCKYVGQKSYKPWNKDLKGIHLSPHSEFKKGMVSLFKGTKGLLKANSGSFQKGHSLNKGEKSYLWKGGITPINKLLRRSTAFKEWRESVFKRDNWTCQACEVRGGELHPDHIKQWALFPELRFELSNGRTLCKDCHMKTDTWGRNIPKVVALNN